SVKASSRARSPKLNGFRRCDTVTIYQVASYVVRKIATRTSASRTEVEISIRVDASRESAYRCERGQAAIFSSSTSVKKARAYGEPGDRRRTRSEAVCERSGGAMLGTE